MAKVYTKIGYAPSYVLTAPGVWEEKQVIKPCYADILRNSRSLDSNNQVNDSINVSLRFSIVADPFARENFHTMRWIEYAGAKWKISDVAVEYPRLILSIGGLYHGDEDETSG